MGPCADTPESSLPPDAVASPQSAPCREQRHSLNTLPPLYSHRRNNSFLTSFTRRIRPRSRPISHLGRPCRSLQAAQFPATRRSRQAGFSPGPFRHLSGQTLQEREQILSSPDRLDPAASSSRRSRDSAHHHGRRNRAPLPTWPYCRRACTVPSRPRCAASGS